MVTNAYSTQFFGVAVTLLVCSITYRVAAIAILFGIFISVVILLYTAVVSSFPEVAAPSRAKFLKSDYVGRPDVEPSIWESSELAINHPTVAEKIEEITVLLIRGYVTSWFQHIDPRGVSGFQEAAKYTILSTVLKLYGLSERMDETSVLILRLMPLFTKHFEAFRLAKQALESKTSLAGSIQNAELQQVIEYNKVRKLHPSLSLRPSHLHRDVKQHLTAKVEKILPRLVDERELSSPFVFILLRDILASCLLEPLVVKFSDADFWNLTMISISDKVLEEHDQVTQVKRFLSKEVEVQDGDAVTDFSSNSFTNVDEELLPGITGTQFELYLRQISQLSSPEALQKERFLIIAKLLSLKNDKFASNSPSYEKRLLLSLNLLQTRLRCVDSRSITPENPHMTMDLSDAMKIVDEFEGFLKTLTLIDILQEPKCLVYFEEYLTMKLYRRAACYLSFWKLIENIRNPLEDAHEGIVVTISPSEIAQLRDVASEFFQNEQLEFMKILDPGLVTNITLFTRGVSNDASRTFALARRSILLLQGEAQRVLESDFFQGFKTSKVFLDMIASTEFAGTELYARIVAVPQLHDVTSNARTRDYFSTIRVFTNPGIDSAINNILNRKINKRRRAYSQQQQKHDMKDKPLEVNDIKLRKDALFEDEDEDDEMINLGQRCITKNALSDSTLSDNEFSTSHKFTDLEDQIARLTVSVDQIEKQLEVLKHLILKAELTNNQKQLKLLVKSQRALIRDLDHKELLKQQLIVCQNANSLYKKTKVAIKSYFIDTTHKNEGRVIYYMISVDHINNGHVATWTVPRRFSEFYCLHSYMKVKYKNLMKNVMPKEAFPKKVKLSLMLNSTRTCLYQERKVKLERYIRELLKIQDVCRDDLLRKFLTDSSVFSESSIASTLIKSNATGECSSAEGSIYSSSSDKGLLWPNTSSGGTPIFDVSDENDDEFSFFQDEHDSLTAYRMQTNAQDKPFVKAICDTFISVFSLNKTNSGWLRGRAIVTILQQLLGSAIERYIMDAMTKVTSEAQVSGFLTLLKEKLWDSNGDRIQKDRGQRPPGEVQKTREESLLMFKCLFTEVCGKIVGLSNAQQAANQLHEMAQNSYLTANLILEIIDALLEELMAGSRQKSNDVCEEKPTSDRGAEF